ncbi:MAG TPA: hypothetical protein VHG69_13775 [Thermoleophilaceae bacterium]|nr:hypothetical protein [Thermoleophilaceae bacterium]
MEGERPTEFLPPEPPGPEPELEGRPQPPPPPPPQAQPPSPPAYPQQYGWQPAPGQPPPAQPPPGYPPPGWQQPPPQGWVQPAWGYPQQPPEPGDGAAVGGFVTSVSAAALLLMSFGFLAFLTVIAAPFGIFYSRKGKKSVDEGKTRKHRGLAQAGFVIGIVTLVISAIVTILLIIFIIALATDEEFRRDFENDGGFDSTTVSAAALAVRAAGAAVRFVA